MPWYWKAGIAVALYVIGALCLLALCAYAPPDPNDPNTKDDEE